MSNKKVKETNCDLDELTPELKKLCEKWLSVLDNTPDKMPTLKQETQVGDEVEKGMIHALNLLGFYQEDDK